MLIVKEGKILGVTRKNDTSKYGLPGGKVDIGETAKEAAIRETLEETNILVKECDFFFSKEETSSNETYCTYCYYATVWEGDPKALEAGKVDWISTEDLMKGSFPIYNKCVIDKMRNEGLI